MYPEAIDRYRIIEKLAKWARETCSIQGTGERGIKQRALAERVHVDQSTISNIENLTKSLKSPKRFPDREEFLKVLAWGLELDQERIDTIFWLYEGTPLTGNEIRRYVRGYLPQATPKNYTFPELCKLVLSQLEEVLTQHTRLNRVRTVRIKVIPFGDEQDELESYGELLRIEQIPGQSFMATAYPSHLVNPPEMQASGELIRPPVVKKKGRQGWLRMNEERVELFLSNLANYGKWSIHSKPILEHYLKEKNLSRSEGEQRKNQLEHWITLLETYEHYQVGLARTTPYLEPKIKSTVMVMVRSSPDYKGDEMHPRWGPQYLVWSDEDTVLRFFLDFEAAWDTIPEEDRTKAQVIGFLREMVSGKR